MRRVVSCLAVGTAFAVIWAGTGRGEDWPQFRGPTGQGQASERGLPTTWGGESDENIVWKVPLPHVEKKAKPDLNQSSPIVWRDRLVVTTCCWPEKTPQKKFPEHHVTCYAAADGRQLWDVLVPPGPWQLTDFRGGYASPTPTTDGERVYVAFGSATIAALNLADGKLLWQKEIENYKEIDVAFSTSPLLFKETVLLLCDKNNKTSTLTAYDCKSGEVKWEQKRPTVIFNHTTPILVKMQDRPLLLINASNALQGVDPTNGEIVWSCPAKGDVPMPVYDGKLVFSDSGRGGPGIAVDPTGSEKISAKNIQWKIPQIPEGMSSPVLAGEWLYRVHNPGIVKCFSMTTGEEQFSKRLEGISTLSSPFAVPEGLVYFASAGKSYVLKAGAELEVVATNELNDPCAASAAIAGGKIFLKGAKHLYCVGKK